LHPWVPCNKKHGGRTTGSTGITPAFPAQWFTAYFVLSPVTGLFCHRRLRIRGEFSPVGPALASAKLDASVGASGPHDFAVRDIAVRLRAVNCSRARRPALRPQLRADAAASTASRPAFVTIASRPSVGQDGRACRTDFSENESGIFFESGLDKLLVICPTGSLARGFLIRRAPVWGAGLPWASLCARTPTQLPGCREICFSLYSKAGLRRRSQSAQPPALWCSYHSWNF
jgi:hypothetical protein